MREENDTRKQFIEEPPQDLELNDEDAEKVAGGHYIDKASPNIAPIPPTPPKTP